MGGGGIEGGGGIVGGGGIEGGGGMCMAWLGAGSGLAAGSDSEQKSVAVQGEVGRALLATAAVCGSEGAGAGSASAGAGAGGAT